MLIEYSNISKNFLYTEAKIDQPVPHGESFVEGRKFD